MGAAKGVRLHHETKYNKNIIKIKINQYEKLDGTKQNSEDDSATFLFRSNIYNDIKKFYIVVGKLFSTHATVCTSLILQASNGAGLIGPLLKKGRGWDILQIILTLRRYMLGADNHGGHCQRQIGQLYEQNRVVAPHKPSRIVCRMYVCHACVIMCFREVDELLFSVLLVSAVSIFIWSFYVMVPHSEQL